jgi:hypothetical protein
LRLEPVAICGRDFALRLGLATMVAEWTATPGE